MSKNFYNCVDGYRYTTGVYRDRPLAYCPYGSCGVIETKDALYLKSYTTLVIKYDKKRNTLQCSGTYSATTRKHIGAFLKEYFPTVSYYTMKQCYLDSKAYNPTTGEIIDQYGNTDIYGFKEVA